MPLAPGDVLAGKLELLRELGRGGMGAVWAARNRALGSLVAVKVLLASPDGTAGRERFEREARRVAQLDHPHIVKVFDFGLTATAEPYLVMELLEGEDLATHVGREGPLAPAVVGRLLAQAADALDHAHARGLVHRDVKPENLFLLGNVTEPFLKVLDFGIAKGSTDADADDDKSLTATGSLLGTPAYMSPEQLVDPKRVDARTDVWALGVVAFQALTARLPFVGETFIAMGHAILKGDRPRLHDARPELPAALDRWLDGALELDADLRFGSVKELSEAFAVALRAEGDAPVALRTNPSSREVLRLERADTVAASRRALVPRRAGWPVVVGAAALGALTAGLAVWTTRAADPAPAPPSSVVVREVLAQAPPPAPPGQLSATASAPPPPATASVAAMDLLRSQWARRDAPAIAEAQRLVRRCVTQNDEVALHGAPHTALVTVRFDPDGGAHAQFDGATSQRFPDLVRCSMMSMPAVAWPLRDHPVSFSVHLRAP